MSITHVSNNQSACTTYASSTVVQPPPGTSDSDNESATESDTLYGSGGYETTSVADTNATGTGAAASTSSGIAGAMLANNGGGGGEVGIKGSATLATSVVAPLSGRSADAILDIFGNQSDKFKATSAGTLSVDLSIQCSHGVAAALSGQLRASCGDAYLEATKVSNGWSISGKHVVSGVLTNYGPITASFLNHSLHSDQAVAANEEFNAAGFVSTYHNMNTTNATITGSVTAEAKAKVSI